MQSGNNNQQAKTGRDQQGDLLMTAQTIRSCCKIYSLPENPQFNDKLYLYEKGFKRIQSLQQYTNIQSLWLNTNKISKIQNLQTLKNLVCLYLNNNNISKIQGLNQLINLQVLNLQNNKISRIQNLQTLHKLKSLNLSQNNLSFIQSIEKLKDISNLNNLDLSKNQIQNSQQVFQIIKSLTKVACLSIKSTPFARGYKNYRKKVIAVLTSLKFFDDRPVQQSDHRLCQAWVSGGVEQQKKERNKIKTQQSSKKYQNLYQSQKQMINKSKQIGNESIKNEVNQFKQSLKSQNKQKNSQAYSVVSNNGKNKQFLQNQFNYNQFNQKQFSQQKIRFKQQTNDIKLQHQVKLKSQSEQKLQGWNNQYYSILEALLQKSFFDFSQAQPQFNMIITEINKKLSRQNHRFQIMDLQKVWNLQEIRRRKQEYS